jgi:ferrous iron transport protein B
MPRPPLVAIIGNPNTGKTTLFNALTGLRQRTGNYPGVTVSRKSGFLDLPGAGRVELLDLPGLYSLAATSPDEHVVLDALAGRLPNLPKPDVILCVADSTNLQRNLFLASQAAELQIPLALVLNHADVTRQRGITLDNAKIAERLGGIPVVPASAWRGEGLDAVRQALVNILETKPLMRRIEWRSGVTEALTILREGLERERAAAHAPGTATAANVTATNATAPAPTEAELQRLLFDAAPARNVENAAAVSAFSGISTDALTRLVRAARERIRHDGLNPFAAEAVLHYEHLRAVLDGTVTESVASLAFSRRLDTVLLHRVAGPLIFLSAMAVLFTAVFKLASIPQDWIESFFDWSKDVVKPLLENSPILQSLVVDGVIAGVGAFTAFLPQIVTLFFFVALLEDSGYMARAAFLMDRLFSWCGLNGRSFVPMLSGYACAVPSVLATRVIEDPKARAATAFLVPFMSCSARLPVYTLMISAFIVPALGTTGGVLVMIGMYLLGLLIALPTAFIITRFVVRSRPQPFVLELPRYQLPSARDVLVRVWDSASEFVKRAGTVIFSITVIVWALLYFPHSEEVEAQVKADFVAAHAKETGKTPAEVEALLAKAAPEDELAAALENTTNAAHTENSYLGRFGKFVQPVFAPAGFDWRITVGVLASFPAREAIIATLGTTYSLGTGVDEESGDLKTAMAKVHWTEGPLIGKPVFTLSVAFGVMAFFALCSQCGATLAVIRKESGLRWAVASFLYMTALAWVAAVTCFQVGNLL